MTTPSNISGELRNWYVVQVGNKLLVKGKAYGHSSRQFRDGMPLTSGIVVQIVEDLNWIVFQTQGDFRYLCWKDKHHPEKHDDPALQLGLEVLGDRRVSGSR